MSRNVCELVNSPRIVSHEGTPLTLKQAYRLLECAGEHRLEVLLTMAVVTGMRRGELSCVWWRWGGVEPPVQTGLPENVLQA